MINPISPNRPVQYCTVVMKDREDYGVTKQEYWSIADRSCFAESRLKRPVESSLFMIYFTYLHDRNIKYYFNAQETIG